ncbi:TetR/AcrR family transcriptional regulator [Pelagibius litoralis]|uniref:TetR/AcrR family transcriptional regulator n=1 Tax=Pelagibius litoralis TaxID=374515 RepID=A0A967F0G5_9PROT|nr:TetR/AcrR family transcriptional regulator [Pelagibius litoralis]NIA70794.1 TetR/AcrR family transcriptional regulator [Pelagibius litoralis]
MSILPAQKTPVSGGKRAAQKAETRRRIMQVGRKMLSEKGYLGTTVTMLAAEAGVSAGLINAHFGSKAGLMFAILTEQNTAQLGEMASDLPQEGPVRARLLRKLQTEYAHDLADPKLTAILVAYSCVWPAETEQENIKQRRAGDAVTREILQAGVARGEIAPQADLEAAIAAIYAITLWGMRPAFFENASADECLARITPQIDLILRGLAPAS